VPGMMCSKLELKWALHNEGHDGSLAVPIVGHSER
jgi:hypothetical protein